MIENAVAIKTVLINEPAGSCNMSLVISFIKNINNDILIAQIYVDDIIFGSTNEKLCEKFSENMQKEFEMSMMGELTFFLGLQIK